MSLENKKIVVTGVASGIGAETAKALKSSGAVVIGLDRNEPKENVDQYIKVDQAEPDSIAAAVEAVPSGIDALCNIAGLPPTKDRVAVLKVNFLGLRHLTELMIDIFNDNASIVNVASLAGLGWPEAGEQIKAFLALRDFDAVEKFCDEYGVGNEGGRSYFFSKEALIVWTMMNRWTWRDRGIRMNCVSPGPVETPILPDFLEPVLRRRQGRTDQMEPGHSHGNHRCAHHVRFPAGYGGGRHCGPEYGILDGGGYRFDLYPG
jgi:NAD(P)-dependent dehydrogenase (short-subunit alcohol dehydrogenase family)